MSMIINRIKPLLCRNFTILDKLESSQNNIFTNLVRWRKRRWLPVNKSKIFYVHEKKRNVEEQAEFKKLYDVYNTSMRAIVTLLKTEVENESRLKKQASVELNFEMESLLKENDEWNKKSASIREVRQNLDRISEKKNILSRLSEYDVKRKISQEENESLVLVQKELEKKFVDVDNLDAEIDEALTQKHCFNYVIDTQGNKYVEGKDGSLTPAAK